METNIHLLGWWAIAVYACVMLTRGRSLAALLFTAGSVLLAVDVTFERYGAYAFITELDGGGQVLIESGPLIPMVVHKIINSAGFAAFVVGLLMLLKAVPLSNVSPGVSTRKDE